MSLQTEARPRRLVPRYPLSHSVRVRTAKGPARSYPARDVSCGGLFLATEEPLELFSDVQLEVDLPGGRSTTLSARVVHVLSLDKARSFGMPAGIGVQFEDLSAAQRESVGELVEWARASDPRPRIARIKPGADLTAVQREPMLSFMLEHIDGVRDPEALSQELALEVATIERMLEELRKLGAIELAPATQVATAPTSTGARSPAVITPPAARDQTPTSAAHPTAAREPTPGMRVPQPSAAGANTKQLDNTVQEQLSLLEARLPTANHYALLGVGNEATTAQIRSAFQARDGVLCSAEGTKADMQRIERVLTHLREAYGVLSSPVKRAEYDEYLSRAQKLADAEAMRARVSPRPAQPEQPLAADSASARTQPSARVHTTPEPPPAAKDSAATKSRPAEDSQLGAAARILAQAEQAHADGRMEEAHRHIKLLSAMRFNDEAVQARVSELKTTLTRVLAVDFEKQAAYEEKQQHWAHAAHSWLRVAEGRPSDSLPLHRAALAQLQAGVELRQVMELAKRAVELGPNDAQAHRTLARVYLAADMQANARRELEAAQRCSGEAPAKGGLFKRLLGRDAN